MQAIVPAGRGTDTLVPYSHCPSDLARRPMAHYGPLAERQTLAMSNKVPREAGTQTSRGNDADPSGNTNPKTKTAWPRRPTAARGRPTREQPPVSTDYRSAPAMAENEVALADVMINPFRLVHVHLASWARRACRPEPPRTIPHRPRPPSSPLGAWRHKPLRLP